jgi:hypothetical protein
VVINGYNKLEKCSKIRRCKVDRRGRTTRETNALDMDQYCDTAKKLA